MFLILCLSVRPVHSRGQETMLPLVQGNKASTARADRCDVEQSLLPPVASGMLPTPHTSNTVRAWLHDTHACSSCAS
jgi:hypothetical protein